MPLLRLSVIAQPSPGPICPSSFLMSRATCLGLPRLSHPGFHLPFTKGTVKRHQAKSFWPCHPPSVLLRDTNPQHPTRHCPPPPRTLAPHGSPQATSRHECFFPRTSLVLFLLQPAPPTLIRLPLPYSQHTSLHGHHPSSAHTHLLPKLSSFLSVTTCPSRPLPEGPLSLVHARPQACLQPLHPTPDMVVIPWAPQGLPCQESMLAS